MMIGIELEVIRTPNGGMEFIHQERLRFTGGPHQRDVDYDKPVIRLGPEEVRLLREFLSAESVTR